MSPSSLEEFENALGLTSPIPINFHTAIEINSCQEDGTSELSQWPSHMLKEIMSLSSDFLEMPDKIRNMNTLTNMPENDVDDGGSFIENPFYEDDEPGLIHPMDVFLYLFFSCDSVFRQSFVTQVAKSQLSIPLIAIDPQSNCPTLYLFALQTLFKDCYTDQNCSKSFPVVEEGLPIISFLRLGDCEDSKKSQVLNEIIGIKHSYFFDRSSQDSIRKTLFLKGTVEIAWYFPGMKHRKINEPLVFLNLRGNALHYPKQVQFMAKISTLLCLFIPSYSDNEKMEEVILNLKENYDNKLLFLVYDSSNNSKCFNLPKCVTKSKTTLLKLENIKQSSNIICNKLVNSLEKVNKLTISLKESQNIANQLAIVVDNNDVILNTNNNLQDMLAYLRNSIESHKSSKGTTSLALAKKENLPHQGKPWKDWAKAHCDQFLGKADQLGANLEEYKKEIIIRMDKAREDQLQVLLKESHIFLKKILELNHNEVVSDANVFFVNWKLLQNELNLISIKYLPSLHEQYKTLHRKPCLKDESVDGEMLRNNAEQDLLIASNNIIESSFGIEHVFRELGQVYETYLHFSNNYEKFSLKKSFVHDVINLPDIVASLMLSGQSLEIMDGSVNHVPHDWVRDVLKRLSNLIGIHKKIFVLTILGIQSSGKSTLLNTMFGVNFSVSSGRCTRGVFMQIIPIDEKLANNELGYDYLVLLDTEGLRAAELLGNSCYTHDNQLATFVIGIGDLTLINIFGENLTEMQEIIQITVIAFMRMNISVHKRPKCIFVHQNVGDIHADKNLMLSRSNIIKTLNEATKIAAIQEKKDTIYKQFSDVIEFDSESDVFCFPNLLDGEPPMTRVSTGYSRCAKNLKNKILTIIPPNRRKEFLSINDWNCKIHLIWESILKENFAFGYRNILELHCRFKLDSALCDWSSDYAHSMLTYKSNVINILLNIGPDELENKFQHIKSELLQFAEENILEIQNNIINHFFSQSENKVIYLNWKASAQSHFKTKRIYERERMLADCDHVVNVQRQKYNIDSEFQKYKKDIVSKTVTLFKQVYSENSEEIEASVENKFESLWANNKISVSSIHIQPANIVSDCQKAIVESHYLQSMSIISEKRELISKLDEYKSFGRSDFLSFSSKLGYKSENPYYIEIDMRFLFKKCSKLTSKFWNTQNSQKTKYNDQFEIILQKFSDNVDEFITKNNFENINYNSEFYFMLICFIYKDIEDFNKEQGKTASHCIELTNNFIFDFIFYKCCTAITLFEMLQQSFIERTNLNTKLNQLKCELRQMFLDSFKNIGVEHDCAGKLTQILIRPMKNLLTNFAIQTLQLNFKSDTVNVSLFKSRSALQLAVLKDLAQKKKFTRYTEYIKFPIKYLNSWIIRKLKKFSKDQNTLKVILSTLNGKIDKLCKTYNSATQKANLVSKSFSDRGPHWKSCFHSEIMSDISDLKMSDLEILDVYSISNYENFSQFFAESLQNEIANCDWSAWLTEVFSNTKLPSHTITDSLLECKALCPFCNEPCRLSAGEHEHYCGSFHRPQGINGTHYRNSEIITTEECTISLKLNQCFWYKNTCYKYEDYRTINENFRSWTILADDALESKYWQWVLYTFQKQFLNFYDTKYNAKIEDYSYLTEEDIIRDIEKHYQNYTFRQSS